MGGALNVARSYHQRSGVGQPLRRPVARMLITFAAIVIIALPVLAGMGAVHLHGMVAAVTHLAVAIGVLVVYVVERPAIKSQDDRALTQARALWDARTESGRRE